MENQKNVIELLKIFDITKKSILEKHCKNLKIYAKDFSNLINWVEEGKSNYDHKIYCREIVPKDLQPLLNELPKIRIDKIGPNDQSILLRKIAHVIKVRRQLVLHMFHNKDVSLWHLFYFDQRDTSVNNNRWEFGSHIPFCLY